MAQCRFTPPVRRYAAYLFDCDGTLVDSMQVHFHAWRHALDGQDPPFDFDWQLFLSRAGMPAKQTVLELNAQFGCSLDPAQIVPLKDSYFKRLQPTLQPISEVVDFARQVASFAPLAVASGGARVEVQRSLRLVGILDLFQCLICAEDVVRGKPDPEVFLECARRLGVASRQCLVVEDGESGILAAKAAGMDCVVVGPVEPSPVP